MNKKLFLTIGLFGLCAVAATSVSTVNFNRLSGSTSYTCYIPDGETEIKDILANGVKDNYYITRGTITRIVHWNDGTCDAYIQRTNGEDGSKSSIKLLCYPDSLLDGIKEGNVIDVKGSLSFQDEGPVLYGATKAFVTKVSETNPNPVEALELTPNDFVSQSFSDNDLFRFVKLKGAGLPTDSSISSRDGGGRLYIVNGLSTADRSTSFPLYTSTGVESRAEQIWNTIQFHRDNHAVVDITGFVIKNNSEYVLQVVRNDDIEVVSTDEVATKEIKISAFNDFHGAIDASYSNIGLARLGTYLDYQSQQPNTLTIDSGDTWQGSIYSNYNHGQMINDVMNYAKLSARTIGNHDFDWGIDQLKTNTAASYMGYSTPVLAANVYDYNFTTKVVGDTQQSEIGQKSVTYTLENGLKVGIIGGIGKDQMTSITSSFTTNIAFKEMVPVIKEEATALRADGCDVVIASVHAGQSDLTNKGLEDYVDLVLCGHTHRTESTSNDDLYFVQCGSYGSDIGEITLTYDTSTNSVVSTDIVYKPASVIATEYPTLNSTIMEIINNYSAECQAEADVIVASDVVSGFAKGGELANLMCYAMYDRCVQENYDDVYLTYCNTARANLSSGTWTYADLYEAFPFDNTVFIMEVTGEEILTQCKNNNNIYINPNYLGTPILASQKYKIACLDYLAKHTNTERNYDYFPYGATHILGSLSKNYRLILKEFLINNDYADGKELDSYDFYGSNYSRSSLTGLQYTITLDYNYESLGTYNSFIVNAGSAMSALSSYNPKRTNYRFTGWYYESNCQTQASTTDIPDRDITLYAGWEEVEVDPDALSTGELDYETFLVGTESTTAYAGTQQVLFEHSPIANKASYKQFGISNYGFIQVSAPSGYVITNFEMKVYNTYDNFTFYPSYKVMEPTLNDEQEGKVYDYDSSNKSVTYNVNPNSRYLYLSSAYSGAVSVWYINVTIAPAS